MVSLENSAQAIRRSTRLPLEIPVEVTSLDTEFPFAETCQTTLVNAHGCGVISQRMIRTGTQVRIEIVSGASRPRNDDS